jgi:hypothetical protein
MKTLLPTNNMIIEGFCNDCSKWFNAHWSHYPDAIGGILNPYCLDCKGHNVFIRTDEEQVQIEEMLEGDDE